MKIKIDHVAIWADNVEQLKTYYQKYFEGSASNKYTNEVTGFSSYFISFQSGARLEIMSKPGIPDNLNDTVMAQYKGIIHIAFEVDTMIEVVLKAEQLRADGFKIVSGPRKTGDDYYEFETLDPDNNRIEVTTKYYE
jgi:lactoylglutathione lyase